VGKTTYNGRQVMAIVHLDLWSRWIKKGNIEFHTAFFQNHDFVWSLPRNIGHRPSKCQELNKFYIFTYLCYWFLLFMLFFKHFLTWFDQTDEIPDWKSTWQSEDITYSEIEEKLAITRPKQSSRWAPVLMTVGRYRNFSISS
jgi:hypothetical protein